MLTMHNISFLTVIHHTVVHLKNHNIQQAGGVGLPDFTLSFTEDSERGTEENSDTPPLLPTEEISGQVQKKARCSPEKLPETTKLSFPFFLRWLECPMFLPPSSVFYNHQHHQQHQKHHHHHQHHNRQHH